MKTKFQVNSFDSFEDIVMKKSVVNRRLSLFIDYINNVLIIKRFNKSL